MIVRTAVKLAVCGSFVTMAGLSTVMAGLTGTALGAAGAAALCLRPRRREEPTGEGEAVPPPAGGV